MADTISEALEADAILGVQRTIQDGHSVDLMSVDDRIKADRYRKGQQACAAALPGLRIFQIVPGSGAGP